MTQQAADTDRTQMPQGGVWAVIAGGGTAGHLHPGLAIAEALVRRGHDPAEVHFVGSARGVERQMVPAAGFALTELPGRGIQRRLTAQNASAVWGLSKAVVQARQLLRQLQPAVVLGLGGYASVPCALAARRLGIPLVIAEQNAVPGAANRLTGRWATTSAVSFSDTKLPRAVLTGNPVRHEVRNLDRSARRSAARDTLGVPQDRTLLAIFGGSLGAARINRAVFEAIHAWSDRGDLVVYHVVGHRDWEELSHLRPTPSGQESRDSLQYVAVPYEQDMAGLYAAADMVLGRAGASTVAELTVVGLPSVLVPLPGAPGDHQTANAAKLAAAGAALSVPDAELTSEVLRNVVEELLNDPQRLRDMATAAASLGQPDADDRVAQIMEKHAIARRDV